ncbi:MAG: hypothetical protein ACI363_06770 [Phocaeicola plebeius]
MTDSIQKQELVERLKRERCFWSYKEDSIKDIPDDFLIEKTLLHLDLDDIDRLFQLYPYRKVKQVWVDRLVPQEEYLHTLNRFLAWYYFRCKRPDTYLKSMATRRLNRLFS